jgi:hypothetical protein
VKRVRVVVNARGRRDVKVRTRTGYVSGAVERGVVEQGEDR